MRRSTWIFDSIGMKLSTSRDPIPTAMTMTLPAPLQTIQRNPRTHRAEPIVIPDGSTDAAAAVLAFIQTDGSTPLERSAALEAFSLRVNTLLSRDKAGMCEELAAHASILTALFQRFTVEVITAPTSEAKAKFGKLAIHAQTAALRTLSALDAVQQRGLPASTPTDD